jgi:hypothetical protein
MTKRMSFVESASSWLTTFAPCFSSGFAFSAVRFQTERSQPPLARRSAIA